MADYRSNQPILNPVSYTVETASGVFVSRTTCGARSATCRKGDNSTVCCCHCAACICQSCTRFEHQIDTTCVYNLCLTTASLSLPFQGLGSLQQIGQDLFIRGNPQLTTLADLPRSLRSIGAFRGGDVWIQNNARLATLSGLQNVPVYGYVAVEGNPELPGNEAEALQKQAQPFPMTVEVLKNGLPSNVTRPAAAAAAVPLAAAVAPAANATVAGPVVPPVAGVPTVPIVTAAGAPVVPRGAPTTPPTSG